MARWAEDNTARIWVKIHAHGENHTTKARLLAGATSANFLDAEARIRTAYSRFEAALPSDFAVVGIRVADAGSLESRPMTPAAIWSDIVGGELPKKFNTAKYMNFVGSGTGRGTCSIKIWGLGFVALTDADDDYRRTAAEDGTVALVKAALDGSTPLFVLRNGSQAVFGSPPVTRVSAFWQTALHR